MYLALVCWCCQLPQTVAAESAVSYQQVEEEKMRKRQYYHHCSYRAQSTVLFQDILRIPENATTFIHLHHKLTRLTPSRLDTNTLPILDTI